MTQNIVWQNHAVDRVHRARIKSQRPCLLWFTRLGFSADAHVESIRRIGEGSKLIFDSRPR